MPTRRDALQGALWGTAGAALASGLILPAAFAESGPAPAAPSRLPKVTGPITGGKRGWPFAAYFGDIGKLGYVEEEYFLEGNAVRYLPVGDLGLDGRWQVKASPDAARYKTRILVRRPRDPSRFNGTVMVEWANVSSGHDIYICDAKGLYDGFAYVAVSAQRVGVNGYQTRPNPMGLVQWDPQRYAGLDVPSDDYSYDIFTQAARVIGPKRRPGGPDPMGGLDVRRLIAGGASQSGLRVLSYANAVQPLERAFDAIMPIVCAGNGALVVNDPTRPETGIDPSGVNHHSAGIPTKVRDDLSVPVMEINTQTEALTYFPRRQPDTGRFVEWEIAGASHAPDGGLDVRGAARDGLPTPQRRPAIRASTVVYQPTIDAAIRHVHGWINGGPPPPSQPKMQISGAPPQYVLDDNGNAIGGVRLPDLNVPIATYVGTNPALDLLGETIPFSDEKLKRLYPTHADYVQKVTAAAKAALRAGVIPPYRVDDYVAQANAAAIPPP